MTRLTPSTPLLMLRLLGLLACIASGGQTHAQIRTDGSVGPAAQSLAGPSYQIPQTLGKLAGSNLFHSFQTFNIGSGQSATFSTSTPGISNVISRVTGGQMSQINGALNLSAASGSPAFYFINPAGITFGAGASVDVPGAFHVGTANSVKFADGRFNADLNQGSTFSSAPPEAFGFLGNSRASIDVRDSAVLSPKGTFPISVVAGDVTVTDSGFVGALNGEIRVVAVGGIAAEIPFTGQIPKVEGNLVVSNEARIVALGLGALRPGPVNVHAGDIALSYLGNITSANAGSGDAAGIQIQSTTASLSTFGNVYSRVTGAGSGRGANIDLTIAQELSLSVDASISSDTSARGSAGNVRVQAGSVQIDFGAYIGSETFANSTGSTGNVEVLAKDAINLASGGGAIFVRTSSTGAAGTLQLSASDIVLSKGTRVYSAASEGTVSAGKVSLSAEKSILLTEGSVVASLFESSGRAGDLQLSAKNISLDGTSVISSSLNSAGGTATAGSVEINATDSLNVKNNSFINSGSTANGAAGSITIRAGNINFDNGRINSAASGSANGGNVELVATGLVSLANKTIILANSFSLGNAGAVSISSTDLRLSGGSRVASNTDGPIVFSGAVHPGGDAGNIRISNSGTFSIVGGSSISSGTSTIGQGGKIEVSAAAIVIDGAQSSINAAAGFGSTGRVGSVSLTASDSILVSGGAYVSTDNFSLVVPTSQLPRSSLSLSAPRIGILAKSFISTGASGAMSAGNIDVAANRLELAGGLITTEAEQGNGGSISVRSGLLTLTRSQIETSVKGNPTSVVGLAGFGNGGDIRINADALVLDTGFIQANTATKSASGGLVTLNVNTLAASGNTLFVGGQTPFEFNPNLFAFNVIQAAAPTGISGAIEVTSPVLDLTGSLGRVSAQVLDGVALGRDPCRTNAASSLAVVGRGGLPASNRALLGAPSASSWVAPAATAVPWPGFNSPPQHVQLAQASIGCTR